MALSEVRAPMHKNRTTTMGRVKGFYQTGQFFSYINISSKNYTESQGYTMLEHFPILGPHGSWKNYSYEQIKAGPWTPANEGQEFGPTWTTHWFHVTFDNPPESWNGKEVHLRIQTGNECMIYDPDFKVIQGTSSGFREEYILTRSWDSGKPEPLEFYIEMACGGMFGAGNGDLIAPPNNDQFRRLDRVDIAVFDRGNWELTVDFDQINGVAEVLGDTHIGYQAMFVTNEMVNQLRVGNRAKAKEIAAAFFVQGPGEKSHNLYAMGHCHIDCAWLWPYDETIRKCARSFSAQMVLMEEFPFYKFVCSSAQQFAWVQEYYPDVFDKIKEKVADGQFVPVGGCWVEMDGNMPNGEAFLRQFYYGQNYFIKEFGKASREFWLPDTFGYSAQIPQMCKHVGIDRFLTQKMSWNSVNKFPNHNFYWEGIDGTSVITHFPPGDSYGMNGTADELLRSQNNSLDKGRANTGVFLYGYGDGGGGPTRQMIERIDRLKNIDGMPRVTFGDSNEFFAELEKESDKFYKWVGELYLELHNGTYTSQARIKWYNRKCEFFFREIELLMAMAYSMGKVPETTMNTDMESLDKSWREFLLNQFHDVLPGSCIEFAAIDAWEIYENILTNLIKLRGEYNNHILGDPAEENKAILSTLPWDTRMVVFMKPDAGGVPEGQNIQAVTLDSTPFENDGEGRFRVPSTFAAALVEIKGSGYTEFVAQQPTNPVSFTSGTTLTNGLVTLMVDRSGTLPVENLLFDGTNQIPAFNDYNNLGISPGMFYIYDDIPNYWDAWDINDFHLETRRLPNFTDIVVENFADGPLVGGYKFSAKFGNGSNLTRYTILRADSPMIEYYTVVDWKEDHKLLKVEFPLDVLSRDATFEIQYGHAKRPTHINTSWEMAKHEVCGHKWVDISQADKGVSLINDSKYGFHARDNHLSMSLLKSPKNPDRNCDMHKHYIYYAVLPHKGTFQEDGVIQKAYELNTLGANNVPLVPAGTSFPSNFVVSSNPGVFVEAVKVSKVTSAITNTICIRIYEGFGGVASTNITLSGTTINQVFESNGLEDRGAVYPSAGNSFSVDMKPFQIKTFLVAF